MTFRIASAAPAFTLFIGAALAEAGIESVRGKIVMVVQADSDRRQHGRAE